MNTVFDRVKELSEKQKISLVDLEIKVGFSRNSIYSWKKNKPSTEKLERVADFFNVSTDYLLGRDDNKVNHEGKTYDLNDLADEAVFFDGREMTKQDREVVKNILKAYFDNKE